MAANELEQLLGTYDAVVKHEHRLEILGRIKHPKNAVAQAEPVRVFKKSHTKQILSLPHDKCEHKPTHFQSWARKFLHTIRPTKLV